MANKNHLVHQISLFYFVLKLKKPYMRLKPACHFLQISEKFILLYKV